MKVKKIIVVAILITILGWLVPIDMNVTYAATAPQNPKVGTDLSRWDCVYFGRYPQSDSTGKTMEPIKWRVFFVENGIMYLVADKKLDIVQFHKSRTSVSFDNSYIKTWLNGTFKNRAFNSNEQAAMISYDGIGKVSLLTPGMVTGAKYGFINNRSRMCKNTNYTTSLSINNGTPADSIVGYPYYGAYWLNTSTLYGGGGRIQTARGGGYLSDEFYVDNKMINVRPIIKVSINSSLWSHAPKETSDGRTAPAVPADFVVSLNKSNEAVISWSDVLEADGYAVAMYKNGEYVKTYYYDASAFSGTTSLSGLEYTTDYTFKVAAYWNVGSTKVYGSYTNGSTITTKKLSKPTSFSVSKSGMNTAKLKWVKAVDADGYQIYRKLGTNNWKRIATITNGDRNYYNNTQLQLNKKYQYKIRTYKVQNNEKIFSDYTSVRSITTSKLGTPGSFKLTNLSNKRVKCKWTAVTGAHGYQIQCASMSTKKITKDLSGVLSGLKKGKTYKFRVRAYRNVKNESGKVYKAFGPWTTYKSIKVK